MSTFLTKYAGTHKFQNITSEFDTLNFKLTNTPTTNNSNALVLSRNSVSGNIELVSKATITGNISMLNNSVAPGNVPILTNPGSNVAFPGPFSFRSLIPGSNISFTTATNDITINATIPSSNVTVNSLGGTAIVTTTGTFALPGPISFRGLVAGTGISLTPSGTTITITNTSPASGSVNIYNTDGTLTGDRVVNFGLNDLTFNGSSSSSMLFNSMSVFNVNMFASTTSIVMNPSLVTITGSLGVNINGVSAVIDATNVTIGANGSQVNIGKIGGTDEITLQSPILRFNDIPTLTKTGFLLQINPGGASRQVSYIAASSFYGTANYIAQTTQVFTSTTPAVVSGVTATLGPNVSSNIALPGTNDGITYTGATLLKFEVTFVGNILVNAGANQDITTTIFVDGSEQNLARTVINIGTGSGNMCVSTRPIIVSLVSGSNVRVGFARSGTNTSITYTGTLFIRNFVFE